MAGNPEDYSLDVAEPQVALHFLHDANGVVWHHRLLISKLGPGRWIGASPDLELEIIDLVAQRHRILPRRSLFPDDIKDDLYAFDPISKADLERLKRESRTMAVVLGDEDMEEIESRTWVFSDPESSQLGTAVPIDRLPQAVTLGSRGLLDIDGEIVGIEEIDQSTISSFAESKKGSTGDLRLIGLHRDGKECRFIPFQEAMGLLRESSFSDWGFKGPRAVKEFLGSVHESGVDLGAYHLQWAKNSNVNPHSSICHEHRNLLEVLRLGLLRGQLDLSNLLCAELLVRRVVQLEVAVARNSHTPDFAGLDLLMETLLSEGGAASTRSLDEWMTSKLKERAAIAKQTRLFKEEASLNAKNKGAFVTDSDGPSNWRRKKKQPKAKASASSSGAGDQ